MKRVFSILLFTVLTGGMSVMADNADKTLVAWVSLTDKNVRSGSILTIQRGDRFDGIVWAERAPGKWMAGSDRFFRTEKEQERNRVEQAGAKVNDRVALFSAEDITVDRITAWQMKSAYDAE